MKRKDGNGAVFSAFIEFFIAAFLLLCCGWLIYANTREVTPEQLALLRMKFMPDIRGFLRPELRERTAFIWLALLAVPLSIAVIYLSNRLVKADKLFRIGRSPSGIVILNIFILTLLVSCFYQPHIQPQFMYILFDPVWNYLFLLLLASALTVFMTYALFKFDFNKWSRSIFLPLLLFIPFLQVLSCRIYTLNRIDHAVPFHPNIIAYAVSQAAAGNTDYHQYGFYPRLLAPFFRINPPNLLNISAVMGILFIAGCFAVYRALFRNVKNKLLVPAFAVVFFLTTGPWSFLDIEKPQTSIDPYFAYYPVRFIFPALAVWFFYAQSFFRGKYSIFLCGILAGVSLWWNFDSGVAVCGAFFALLFLELVFSRKRFAVFQFLAFLIAASLAFLALLIIFSMQQGELISPAESLKYVKLFSRSGYMMLPLPAIPAPWCWFAGIYLLGIIIGLRSFIAGKFSVSAKMSLFLSVLGIGLFTYYQGRSHLHNLPAVIWPALLLMFIYADRLLRGIKSGMVSNYFKPLLLPVVFPACCALITVVWGSPMLITGVEHTCRYAAKADDSCLLEQNVRFILANSGENKVANIVSDMQGVYYAETGLRAGIPDFNLVEIFFIADWSRIVQELDKADAPLFIARRHLAPWVYEHYTLKAVSGDGSLFYFVPRPGRLKRTH